MITNEDQAFPKMKQTCRQIAAQTYLFVVFITYYVLEIRYDKANDLLKRFSEKTIAQIETSPSHNDDVNFDKLIRRQESLKEQLNWIDELAAQRERAIQECRYLSRKTRIELRQGFIDLLCLRQYVNMEKGPKRISKLLNVFQKLPRRFQSWNVRFWKRRTNKGSEFRHESYRSY